MIAATRQAHTDDTELHRLPLFSEVFSKELYTLDRKKGSDKHSNNADKQTEVTYRSDIGIVGSAGIAKHGDTHDIQEHFASQCTQLYTREIIPHRSLGKMREALAHCIFTLL